MAHSTNTMTLRGTEKWQLLSQQIQLMLKKGMTGNDVYHLFDRMPGYIRKDLHKQITALGFIIDDPLVRINKNPDEPLPLGYSENSDGSPRISADLGRDERNTDKARHEFNQQFSKAPAASTGLAEFAKKFGGATETEVSPAPKPADKPVKSQDDDDDLTDEKPYIPLSERPKIPAKNKAELSKMKNLLRPS